MKKLSFILAMGLAVSVTSCKKTDYKIKEHKTDTVVVQDSTVTTKVDTIKK